MSIGGSFCHPNIRTDSMGFPEALSATPVIGPGTVPPKVMAAVPTSAAWVEGIGDPIGSVIPAKLHCAITSPQTSVGVRGSVPTATLSLAFLPVSVVPTKRLSEVLL